MNATILVVEDDRNIGDLLRTYLERDSYRVLWVRSGEAGLGLAIVKELIKATGGTTRVASATGVGTAFSISLPHDGAPPTPGEGAESPTHELPALYGQTDASAEPATP